MNGPEVPPEVLPVLFPGASPEQLDRVRRAIGLLRAAEWDWFEENVEPLPATGAWACSLIGTIVHDRLRDPLELEMSVDRRPGIDGRIVIARIGIDCWCPAEDDHGMHFLHQVETITTTTEELTAAVESAAGLVAQWHATGRNAEWWRAEAGLPRKGEG